MDLSFNGDKASNKRDGVRTSPRAWNRNSTKTNLLEAMTQVRGSSIKSESDGDGVVRMKIVLSKQQLKQLMIIMENDKNHVHDRSPSPSPPVSPLDQLFRIKQRRQQRRATNVKVNHRPWRPVLNSIPEEL